MAVKRNWGGIDMRRRSKVVVIGAAVMTAALLGVAIAAQSPPGAERLQYSSAGELIRPVGYRDWVFVSSGLGMAYGPNAQAAGRPPSFTNVFVNPSSYRRFMETGTWPDQTMFILEIRASASEGSINTSGHYQAELVAVEAEVKDRARYPDGWAYFDFGHAADRAAPLPTTATCYSCHKSNAAVEQTFVQFYPTLMEVARRMKTVNPAYSDRPGVRH
jgi:Cytochrome P460